MKRQIEKRLFVILKGYVPNGVVGRLDFVESILRRNVRGIWLAEIEVEGEDTFQAN